MWIDELGPYQRGRAIEAFENRHMAPDVWRREVEMPRYRAERVQMIGGAGFWRAGVGEIVGVPATDRLIPLYAARSLLDTSAAVARRGVGRCLGPPGSKSTHVAEILKAAAEENARQVVGGVGKPVLTEAPFGERQLRDELTKAGLKVSVVFIVEDASTLTRRFRNREGKSLPDGALTRAAGLQKRAISGVASGGPRMPFCDI